ncbi:MAG: 2-oxoisovalerate dehydrogenase subunit beta [Fimbriimonadales bacterium]|nr:MAG: 2-oxoisovalerate dehydrogenase subunit beta [Fimbriimonadales bacterium]
MREVTFLEAIRFAMWEEMERDPNVFTIGEDIGRMGGAFGVTEGFLHRFGAERVIDAPISETAIIAVCVGAAAAGKRGIAEMQFIDFISYGFDQVVNVAGTYLYRSGGKTPIPIVVRGPSGGYVGGSLYHSQQFEAWFFHTPGVKVVQPAFPDDAYGLMKASIRDNNPVVFYEHKYLYRRVKGTIPDPDVDYIVRLGEARIRRYGEDITVVTYGAMVHFALEAAQRLDKEGISLEVIDLRTIKPLDMETILESLQKTSKLLVVYEAPKTGGVGAEISARIAEQAFEWLDAPIKRVAAKDAFVPFAEPLEKFVLPSVDDIVFAARELAAY